jgi:hypothetical protein
MPSLHRKTARMRVESAVSATNSSAAASSTALSCSADPSQEKLYSNADVSKMVKEAVSSAVSRTKEVYEKILQEKLSGKFLFAIVFNSLNRVTLCLQSNTNSLFASTKITSAAP